MLAFRINCFFLACLGEITKKVINGWTLDERLTYFLCLLKKKITDKVNVLLFVVHNQEDGVVVCFRDTISDQRKDKVDRSQ